MLASLHPVQQPRAEAATVCLRRFGCTCLRSEFKDRAATVMSTLGLTEQYVRLCFHSFPQVEKNPPLINQPNRRESRMKLFKALGSGLISVLLM